LDIVASRLEPFSAQLGEKFSMKSREANGHVARSSRPRLLTVSGARNAAGEFRSQRCSPVRELYLAVEDIYHPRTKTKCRTPTASANASIKPCCQIFSDVKGIPRAELKGHWTKSLVNFYSAAVEASANP
jgi:hypothetical protein